MAAADIAALQREMKEVRADFDRLRRAHEEKTDENERRRRTLEDLNQSLRAQVCLLKEAHQRQVAVTEILRVQLKLLQDKPLSDLQMCSMLLYLKTGVAA